MTHDLSPEAVTERLERALSQPCGCPGWHTTVRDANGRVLWMKQDAPARVLRYCPDCLATRLYAAIEKARAVEPDESEIGYGYDAHYAAFYRTLLAELGGNE